MTQHEWQNAAVLVVVHFDRRIDAQQQFDFLGFSVLAVDHQGCFLLWLDFAFQALQEAIAQPNSTALNGYTKGEKDGFTADQRFFISFAQVWCGSQTEQSARVLARTDPHSTGEWRVKGSVQNFDQFGKAFGCKVGQPMMPQNACRVW